jgi:hypothetical protein
VRFNCLATAREILVKKPKKASSLPELENSLSAVIRLTEFHLFCQLKFF